MVKRLTDLSTNLYLQVISTELVQKCVVLYYNRKTSWVSLKYTAWSISAVVLASTGWHRTAWAAWVTAVSWTSWSSAVQRTKGVNLSSYLSGLNLASTILWCNFCKDGIRQTYLSVRNHQLQQNTVFSTFPTRFQARTPHMYFNSCSGRKTVLMQKGYTALALVFFNFCH